MYTHSCIFIYIYAHTCVCAHMCVCTRVCTHIYGIQYTHTHTHAHTHTHTGRTTGPRTEEFWSAVSTSVFASYLLQVLFLFFQNKKNSCVESCLCFCLPDTSSTHCQKKGALFFIYKLKLNIYKNKIKKLKLKF
jgi:hypothetical protein